MKSLPEIIDEIKDILSTELAKNKVFDKDVANALGIKDISLASLKKRNSIPFVKLLDFCASRSISINTMLYNQSPESIVEATNSVYRVKYFKEIHASAGGGAEPFDEEHDEIALNSNFVDMLGGEKELHNIEAINVTGDSMEPTFGYGDIIFINRSLKNIGRGGVFVLNSEGGLFLKRVQKRIDNRVDIISDNKEYQTYAVNEWDIGIVGKVVGRFAQV